MSLWKRLFGSKGGEGEPPTPPKSGRNGFLADIKKDPDPASARSAEHVKETVKRLEDAGQEGPELTPPKSTSAELLADIKKLVDPASILSAEDIEEAVGRLKDAGEEGVSTLDRCLNDAFATRAGMSRLIYAAREVARHTMDVALISTLEKILVECCELASGYPTPPAWMPQLRPVIAGGGQYGWDDATWIPVAHSTAEFLLDVVPLLPPNLSPVHAGRLSQAIDHYIEKLEGIRGRVAYNEALDKELSYWQSLKARVQR